MIFSGFLDITNSGLQDRAQQKPHAMATIAFEILLSCCLCNIGVNILQAVFLFVYCG
jgi:hypothetical protein